MIVLPELRPYTRRRPYEPSLEKPTLIPDEKAYAPFWEAVYEQLYELGAQAPFRGLSREELISRIPPEHGFFGERFHPILKQPYFHLGVELTASPGEKVFPLFSGVLEYSGFGVNCGYSVLLSHPQIQTEDGYVLHTMYCHLKKPLVKFTMKQKMLREISLGTYPIVPVERTTEIGIVGSSGRMVGDSPVLYLQTDFRKFEHRPIVVDPLRFFQRERKRNVYTG